MLGPNGAGKSTLLSLISGLIRPDAGPDHPRRPGAGRHRARVFVPPHQRARGAARPAGAAVSASDARRPTSRSDRAVPGRSRRDARPGRCAGWRRSMPPSSPTAGRPSCPAARPSGSRSPGRWPPTRHLLLLDEPMSALDVAVAPALRQLLRRVLRDTGRTAVLVTHDMIDALALADRTIVVDGGRIVEDGPTRDGADPPPVGFRRPPRRHQPDQSAPPPLPDCWRRTAPSSMASPTTTCAPVTRRSPCSPRPRSPFTSRRRPAAPVTTCRSPSPRSSRAGGGADPGRREPDGAAGLFADITATSVTDLELVPGQRVHFAVKATEVGIHPRAGVRARETQISSRTVTRPGQ